MWSSYQLDGLPQFNKPRLMFFNLLASGWADVSVAEVTKAASLPLEMLFYSKSFDHFLQSSALTQRLAEPSLNPVDYPGTNRRQERKLAFVALH